MRRVAALTQNVDPAGITCIRPVTLVALTTADVRAQLSLEPNVYAAVESGVQGDMHHDNHDDDELVTKICFHVAKYHTQLGCDLQVDIKT